MDWNKTVDFLVVGSGAGGMAAAIRAHDLGADTLIIEKASVYGGSTAWSGGVIWVPDNPCMKAKGMADSAAEAMEYLETITAGSSSSERLQAYVEAAPRMMEYFIQHTHLKFQTIEEYPDYYPELSGGKLGGRSCEPCVFEGLLLGDEFKNQNLHDYGYYIFGFLTVLARQGKPLMEGKAEGLWIIFKGLMSYLFNFRARLKGRRPTRLTLGGAIIGMARRSLMDRNVPLWLDSKLTGLIVEEGRVVGASIERDGMQLHIRARKGVLLAMGGFEQNPALREKYQQAPTGSQWTAGAKTNTGDLIAISEKLGLNFKLMDDSWWSPIFKVPNEPFLRLVIYEKNLPGGIIVNKKGQRFMNEAAPYNDVGKAIYAANADGSAIPCYLIFDKKYRYKYPVGPVMPGKNQPDKVLSERLKSWMQSADTLAALAEKIGVDAEGLTDTVQTFNVNARNGVDPDFNRGESAQDRYYTVKAEGPNPCLDAIEEGPFYAIEVWPGDLGTKGGVITDERARVLDQENQPLQGLYATGNCSAVLMGSTYPGAGGTIGPAMTFGFIAAEEAIKS